MELAKVTLRGQITIPKEIRKLLGLRDGDRVVFLEDNGRVVMANAATLALTNAQDAFAGLAAELGLNTEEDVVELCREVRKEMWAKRNARDD